MNTKAQNKRSKYLPNTSLLGFIGAAALIFTTNLANSFTGDPANGQVATVDDAGCMQDVYNNFGQGGGLNCTAKDVSLATATNITILDDG